MLSYKLASFWRLLRNKTLLKDPSSIADLRSCSKTPTVAGSGVTKPKETLVVMPCLPEAGGAERQCPFKLTKITKKSSKQKELFEDLKICRSVGTSCTRSGSTAEFPKDSKTNSCSNYFTWARQFTFVRHCLLNGPDKNQLLWGVEMKRLHFHLRVRETREMSRDKSLQDYLCLFLQICMWVKVIKLCVCSSVSSSMDISCLLFLV